MIGENVTDSQLNEMLALADLDKDGRINYEGNYFLYILISFNESQ
jgi:calmodulin